MSFLFQQITKQLKDQILPDFDAHIHQAKKNIQFLSNVNLNTNDYYDWQVTACFYTGLHLINAHLSQFDQQYRTHENVKLVINPTTTTSLMKIPESEYVAYVALEKLSRRARYLVNVKDGKLMSDKPAFTYEKHLAKALRHLDKLLIYFGTIYNTNINRHNVRCSGINTQELQFFKITS